MPLLFANGEAYQFDWSQEIVLAVGLSDSYYHLSVGAGRELRRRVLSTAMCGQRRSLRVTTIVLDL